MKPVVIKNILEKYERDELTRHMKSLIEDGETTKDHMCPSSHAVYKDKRFQQLLDKVKEFVQIVSGRNLLPTYTYSRLYTRGESLPIHIDRESCEISLTLQVTSRGEPWPIYASLNQDKSDARKFVLEDGDALLYNGTRYFHWRDEYKGEQQHQIFIHFVDEKGPFADHKDDRIIDG